MLNKILAPIVGAHVLQAISYKVCIEAMVTTYITLNMENVANLPTIRIGGATVMNKTLGFPSIIREQANAMMGIS